MTPKEKIERLVVLEPGDQVYVMAETAHDRHNDVAEYRGRCGDRYLFWFVPGGFANFYPDDIEAIYTLDEMIATRR